MELAQKLWNFRLDTLRVATHLRAMGLAKDKAAQILEAMEAALRPVSHWQYMNHGSLYK
jgi:hypothetical protein